MPRRSLSYSGKDGFACSNQSLVLGHPAGGPGSAGGGRSDGQAFVVEALKLKPIQANVEYDIPEGAAAREMYADGHQVAAARRVGKSSMATAICCADSWTPTRTTRSISGATTRMVSKCIATLTRNFNQQGGPVPLAGHCRNPLGTGRQRRRTN